MELWKLWDGKEYSQLGFGGARGGAKSGGGRRCMLMRRLKYPGTTGLILRRTYTDLYKSHIAKMFEEFPQLQNGWRESHKELRLPGNSKLFFGSAEHEGDINAFYSAEFADIMVDEAQDFSQAELERLEGSNRCTNNPDLVPKMIYTFMPGFSESGIPPRGLSYLKRVIVEKQLEESERKKNWAFIQAFAWDNIEWCKSELERDGIDAATFYSWSNDVRREYFLRSAYGAKLAGMTDQNLRDAWLYGSWDVFIGQYFPQFSRSKHVFPRTEVRERLRPWWKMWLCGDWGFDHPHSVYKFAIDEYGHVITWGEMWGREVPEEELGQRVTAHCVGEKFIAFPFSWDAGRQSPRSPRKTPRSIIQQLNEHLGPGIPKAFPTDSSPGSRVSRARLMANMLDSGHWMIADDCPRLIECLPSLIRDPRNTEDVRKVDYSENGIGDDPYDAAAMGLAYMCGSSHKPAEVRLRERAMTIQDETERFYFVYKEMAKLREQTGKEKVIPSWQQRMQNVVQ